MDDESEMAKTTNETKTDRESAKDSKKSVKNPSKWQVLRANHKFRLILIGALLVILAIMFVFFEKLRIFIAIIFIVALGAFGLELGGADYDIGTLWETKSFEQSQVVRDDKGNILFDNDGNFATNASTGKSADDYNCNDFDSQAAAQKFFDNVGGTKYDMNRLDGDKDGVACEALRN